MYVSGQTSTGMVRDHNEDVLYHSTEPIGPLPNLFIVADGMGGHNAGEVASAKSLDFSWNYIFNAAPGNARDILEAAALHANHHVFELSVSNPEYLGMGTTFTACSIKDNIITIAHVGDSRIYAISPGNITQITIDHTLVDEMVQAGALTKDEAKTHPRRNVLKRVLGYEPQIQVDSTTHDISHAHSILLCSDGLTDMLSDEEILEITNQNSAIDLRAKALVDAANKAGGVDNITVILVDIRGEVR